MRHNGRRLTWAEGPSPSHSGGAAECAPLPTLLCAPPTELRSHSVSVGTTDCAPFPWSDLRRARSAQVLPTRVPERATLNCMPVLAPSGHARPARSWHSPQLLAGQPELRVHPSTRDAHPTCHVGHSSPRSGRSRQLHTRKVDGPPKGSVK